MGDTRGLSRQYGRAISEWRAQSWSRLEELLREQHRTDMLQVLAYANLACTPKVIACLTYPCSPESWHSLKKRGRLIHRASLSAGSRSVQLWLTAVPMAAAVDAISTSIADELRIALGWL